MKITAVVEVLKWMHSKDEIRSAAWWLIEARKEGAQWLAEVPEFRGEPSAVGRQFYSWIRPHLGREVEGLVLESYRESGRDPAFGARTPRGTRRCT